MRAYAVIPPQIGDAYGTRKWLEPYSPAPHNNAILRRARLTLFDAMLATLRTSREAGILGLIAQGEGAIVAVALLNNALRECAYRERHVDTEEATKLEEVANTYSHVVLITPHSFPMKSSLPFLRTYAPEITATLLQESVQCVFVTPDKDTAKEATYALQACVHGSVIEQVHWQGPAWRTIPDKLRLASLRKTLVAPSQEVNDNISSLPSAYVIEGWAGSAGLTAECARYGFTCRAYEIKPSKEDNPIQEGDILKPENLDEVLHKIANNEVYHAQLAPNCKRWSPLQNLSGQNLRTKENPTRTDGNPEDEYANKEMSTALLIIYTCLQHGVSFALEHPKLSKAWYLAFMQALALVTGVFFVDLDMCAFYKRPQFWTPADGDVRVQAPTRLVTNNPYLESLRRMCVDEERHKHAQAIGGIPGATKSNSEHKGQYSELFCRKYAIAIKTSYTQGFRPQAHKLEPVSVIDLSKKPNLPTERLNKVSLWSDRYAVRSSITKCGDICYLGTALTLKSRGADNGMHPIKTKLGQIAHPVVNDSENKDILTATIQLANDSKKHSIATAQKRANDNLYMNPQEEASSSSKTAKDQQDEQEQKDALEEPSYYEVPVNDGDGPIHGRTPASCLRLPHHIVEFTTIGPVMR